MDSIVASKILIVISIGIMGYNLYQFFTSYDHMERQVHEFLGILEHEAVTAKSVTGLNAFIYFLLPALYLLLLYFAEFSYLMVAIVGIKLFVGSGISFWMQNEIVALRAFPQRFYMINKVDQILNTLLMGIIVYFIFV